MPMMDLTYPAGALDADTKRDLVAELTTHLLKAEGAHNSPIAPEITWVYVNEIDPEDLGVAGKLGPEKPRYRVITTLPQGALSDERKQGFVERVTAAILRAEGSDPEDGDAKMRVWVFINEVPDGNWGAAGTIVRFDQIRSFVLEQASLEAEPAPAAAG